MSALAATLLFPAGAASANHTALLKSVLSGKCVGIAGGSTANAVDAVQSACDGGADQTLHFTPAAGTAGVFTIALDHSGKCLEVAGGSTSAGADVEQSTCDGGTNQQFELVPAPGDAYEIVARHSGLRVSLQTASTADGVKLEQHPDADADHQRWRVANADPRDPAVYGAWGDVLPWPHIAVSGANLPDGRILTFSGSERETWPGTEFTHSAMWDPATGAFVEIDHPTHNMFCAHLAMTEDGRVFVNGGRNQINSPWTSLFDYSAGQWHAIENMATGGRWYPTTLALTDGDMFTALGTATNQRNPERWDPVRGWKVLTGIDFQTPVLSYGHGEKEWWPLLHVAPQGKIFHSGPTPTVGWINPTGNGTYEDTGIRLNGWYHKHGTTIMYDSGKILTAGGWISGSNGSSSNQAFTIDLNGPAPVVQNVAPMGHARKYHNGVMLPTGEVLVIGGNTSGLKFNDSGSVYDVEIWNPDTGLWREGAAMTIPRNYHSIALLLPDGRVLSAGGGYCSDNRYCSGASHPDGEVYSPPYLFAPDGSAAPRPGITSGPGTIDNGSVFDVETTGTIDFFSMIKMGATTHGVNTDVRFLRVASQALGGGTFRLTAHGNPNVLTPGYWMLFAVDTAGVPSGAHVVRVGNLDVRYDNVALAGTATQSSTLVSAFDLDAANAVDGDMTGTAESGSLTHTQEDANAWWELDLHSVYDIDSIRLWNRTDCCGERLSDFWVLVSDEPFVSTDLAAARAQAGVSGLYVGPEVPERIELAVDRTARFVRVQLAGTDFLSLAEVQVFGTAPGAGTPGIVHYDYYRGSFDALPEFSSLTPDRSGTVEGFTLTPRSDNDNFAFRFYGRIAISADGTYTFYTGSDDGSRLWIDGQLVVDNDGLHGAQERQGSMALTAGLHDIMVGFFEKTGSESLLVSYQGPGVAKQEIPASVLSLLPPPGGTGGILREWWTGIAGNAVADLTTDPRFPDAPDGSDTRTTFEAPVNWNDAYGTRMRGFLSPPFSGDYTFWMSSDDNGELWLSTDEQPSNVVLVARVPGWSSSREWDKFPEQQSAPVFLQSGRRYYIEALQKEGAGGDNLAVAWETPFDDRRVIGGGYLSPPLESLEILDIASPPQPVTAPVTILANASGDGVTYSWSFGDGSPDTPFSDLSAASHTYPGPGRYTGTLTIRDVYGNQDSATFKQIVHAGLTPTRPNASSTLVYHEGRAEVWNVNPDNDTVAVIDANADLRIAEIPVGDEPRSLTVAWDGRVWVANAGAGTVTVIDPATLQVETVLPMGRGSRPGGIVADPGSAEVYVTLETTGELVKLDASSATELARTVVAPGIRDLSISADGSVLLVSRFVTPPVPGESTAFPDVSGAGGLVYRIDPTDLSLTGTTVLQHSDRLASEHSGPGLPNYVRAAVISPDGANAWVPSKQDNILRGMLRDGSPLTHDHTVRAISSRILLPAGTEDFASRIDHDNSSIATSVAFGPYGVHLFTALEGNRQVAVSDAWLGNELIRFDVGRAPQGIAVSPSGSTLYVHEFMDRTVSVFDISALTVSGDLDVVPVATIPTVGTEILDPVVLLGKQHFYDARDPRLAAESYMSCASCHSAGGQDGRTWDFTGLGEGLRNTVALVGRGGAAHGRLHWSGNFDEVQDFENPIRAFAGGTGLMDEADFLATEAVLGPPKAGLSADLDALAAYVTSLTEIPESPHRDPSGNLTPQAESGRLLFGSLGCDACHRDVAMTDSATGARHDVGTIRPSSGNRLGVPLDGLDTPSLLGVWNTPPWLHDGSAADLATAVLSHVAFQGMTPSEVDAVVAYLEQVEAGDPDECVSDPDCDDGVYCNGVETCDAGSCVAGAPVVCDDGIPCTTDTCDEAGEACSFTPVHASCGDGSFCNGAEVCDPAVGCVPGPEPCAAGQCDENADVCTECAGDVDCDDGVYCNGAETCVAGACVAGSAVVCDDGVGCTVDQCVEVDQACQYLPVDASCDDGAYCNGTETCDPIADCQAGADPCAPGETCNEAAGVCETGGGTPGARLETGTVTVGGGPVTVALVNTYASPVVVCTVQYADNSLPVVARVSGVTATGFDVRLQDATGGAVQPESVAYLVVEEGVWTVDGVTIEARTYLSTVTDDAGSWVGEAQGFGHAFAAPVVLGQVMSENDPRWSVFWSAGPTTFDPPSATALVTGKTVGEDPDTTRADETVGYVVIEAGHGLLAGVEFEAGLGPDVVQGVGDSPPYAYAFATAFPSPPQVALATMAGMDGTNGGWAQTHGPAPATATTLNLSIDEDVLADAERTHATEQVGYVVFAAPFSYDVAPGPVSLKVTHSDLEWTPAGEAVGYDVVRGSLNALRAGGGDFAASTDTCVADDDPGTALAYASDPPAGEAFWFVVRAVMSSGPMSYDTSGTSQVGSRDPGIDAAPPACP